MSGETNLATLIGSMQPHLHDGVYVFATTRSAFSMETLQPRLMFQEDEGTTLVLLRDAAEQAGLQYEFPSRMITLNIHSSLDAVGFLAAITTRLATLEIGVNPVSAFYHDHLFVPADIADAVMEELHILSREQVAAGSGQ